MGVALVVPCSGRGMRWLQLVRRAVVGFWRTHPPADRRRARGGRVRRVAAGAGERPGRRRAADILRPHQRSPTRCSRSATCTRSIFSGEVEGKPFHTETTLLPETRIIEWSDGQQVETRISQYFAYLDGRIEEVALDYYAQADDGSVWYFGEDVCDYNEDGFIDSTEGTWLAGVTARRR